MDALFATKEATTTTATETKDDLFKTLVANQQTNKWTCDVCCVPNEEKAEKCVECCSKKPSAKDSKIMNIDEPKLIAPDKGFR